MKIAVVAPNWLGDAVMSLPALTALAGTESVTTAVVSSPYTARVYAGVEGVDELVVDDVAPGRWARVRGRARALSALGADAVVLFPPSFSSALPAFLARVPVRVGFNADARATLLTDAPPVPTRGSEHLSVSYAGLVARALARLARSPGDAGPPRLALFGDDEAEARRLLDALGVPEGGYVAVVPGATYGPAKSWFHKRFHETARVLSKEFPVVLLGAPAERELCAAVAGGSSGVHNAAGETSLGGFLALLSGAAAVLANDSGAPHAAAALGAPVVVLFGSTDPAWTRPLGDDVTVIRHRVHCAPCFRRDCPTQLECFDAISVDEVVAAVRTALARASKKGVAPARTGR